MTPIKKTKRKYIQSNRIGKKIHQISENLISEINNTKHELIETIRTHMLGEERKTRREKHKNLMDGGNRRCENQKPLNPDNRHDEFSEDIFRHPCPSLNLGMLKECYKSGQLARQMSQFHT